ncbi:lipopolysaccharide kinase InaA family protein [Acanthopleuribacter pedis]|uniref:3-deoxy-D-manno-octulosonic acid kinase n=1 Tax=Acanthopleuribacter pedis TaxID=442870 RepID=A0A8J7U2Q7_9BACT|nr:lipopolysaccharide kinase InaA family protein [Acanthopleuribacter pedis]MBO1318827.1 hypothetical protein [Acanthopleuribacter pedis]
MIELAEAWQHPDWDNLPRRPLDRRAGRGDVMLIDHPRGPVVARDYRHGGLRRLVLARHFAAGQRAAEEYRIHRHAFERGLATPEPIGWARQPTGLPGLFTMTYYSAWLPDSIGLASALRQPGGARRWTRPVAALLKQLCDSDIWHSDLNLNNWLIGDGRVWLIDFDRGRLPHQLDGEVFLVKALNRMSRSAGKLGLRLSPRALHRFVLECCVQFGCEPRAVLAQVKPPPVDPGFFREIRWKIFGGWRKIG